MSFFIKSCIIGLKNFPAINAEIEDAVSKVFHAMVKLESNGFPFASKTAIGNALFG